ncbi:hypothetical protein BD413DRAFT_540600 [Trametes elegans]|nr:hypothetical protein BD413DRAFT_540600 [Trametes elegans]
MGFGSCTVPIFSCPASALGLGGPFFLSERRPNPNPILTSPAGEHTWVRTGNVYIVLNGERDCCAPPTRLSRYPQVLEFPETPGISHGSLL